MDQGELMHNLRGALSETVHVYGTAIKERINRSGLLHLEVVGTGLGYIELLASSLCLFQGVGDFKITSYESNKFLALQFADFVKGGNMSPYQETVNELAHKFELEPSKIIKSLRTNLDQKSELKQPFSFRTCNCICYDPFSKKTNPSLWEDSFLSPYLGSISKKEVTFATYASFKGLHRTLTENGFTVTTPSGYGGKREFTLATRAF